MSAVCPACGVAVVPGYAKCPKCHASLPGRRVQSAAGGTVAEDRRFPVVPIVAGVAVLLLIVVVVKMTGGDSAPEAEIIGSAAPVGTVQPQPTTAPTAVPFQRPDTPVAPTQPSPNGAAAELERTLRGRRLWSTIDIASPRVDVRSAACDDPAMVPTITSVAPTLHGAGLTHLRCLAQSGTIVFERDL